MYTVSAHTDVHPAGGLRHLVDRLLVDQYPRPCTNIQKKRSRKREKNPAPNHLRAKTIPSFNPLSRVHQHEGRGPAWALKPGTDFPVVIDRCAGGRAGYKIKTKTEKKQMAENSPT